MLPVTSKNRRGRKGTSLILETLSQLIPDINRRSLTIEDFYQDAARFGIRAREMPLREIHGGSVYYRGRPYIRINRLLSPPEKVIAGYHELTHILAHAPELAPFMSSGSCWNHGRDERDAQTVGVIALMPSAAVVGREIEVLMEEFGVKREIAEYRLQLFKRYGI